MGTSTYGIEGPARFLGEVDVKIAGMLALMHPEDLMGEQRDMDEAFYEDLNLLVDWAETVAE